MLKLIAVTATLYAVAFPAPSSAACQSHRCWQRVHTHRVERLVQKRIDAITPFRCFGGRWAVPCNIIGTESKGSWSALNIGSSGTPCWYRACGPYQFLGKEKRVPWPVIVPGHLLETLKRKLAHHREARMLWGQQVAGAACHWCY